MMVTNYSRILKLAAGVVMISFLIVLCVAQNSHALERLTLGSTKSTSSHFIYAQTLSSLINKNVEGVNVTNTETGASVDNMKRLNKGQIDIAGVVTVAVAYASYKGTRFFKEPHPDNRWIMTYYIGPGIIAVRKDQNILKVSDLNGKKINPGIPGSSHDKDIRCLLDALAVKPNWYVGSPGDAVKAMKDRQISGYAKYSSSMEHLDATVIDLKTYMPVDIIGFSEKEVEKTRESCSWITWSYMEKGQMKEMPELGAFWTYTTNAGIATTNKLSQDIVYRMMKTVYSNTEEMKAAFPGFGPSDPKASFNSWVNFADDFVPLHAGAVQFYKENGIEVPKHLIPPEYKSK